MRSSGLECHARVTSRAANIMRVRLSSHAIDQEQELDLNLRHGDLPGSLRVQMQGREMHADFFRRGTAVFVHWRGKTLEFEETSFHSRRVQDDTGGDDHLLSTLSGRICKIEVAVGQKVCAGEILLTVEAMKMEQPILALHDATIASILIQVGDQIAPSTQLLRFSPRKAPM
jgi:acetyl/propionyl-CoA carboxylase alpha subunit